jgi:hypothetical protein
VLSAAELPRPLISVLQTGAATFISINSSFILMRLSGPRSRPNLVKDKNGDLLADSCHNLNGWKNCFYQLLNVLR